MTNVPTPDHLESKLQEHSDKILSAGVNVRRPRSIRDRLMSGAGWSALGRIFSVGAFFAANAIIGRALPKDELSAYFILVMSAVPVMAVLVSLGTPLMLIRAIAESVTRGQPSAARKILKSGIALLLMTSLIMSVLMILATSFLGDEVKWSGLRDHSFLVAIWFCLSGVSLTMAGALRGFDDFRSSAIVGARNGGIVSNAIFLVAVAISYSLGILTLKHAILLQIVAYSVATVIGFALLWGNLRQSEERLAQESEPTERDAESYRDYSVGWLYRESWPNLVNQIVALSFAGLDVFWVGCFTTAEDVANYGVARQLVMLVNAPLLLANIVLPPVIAELYQKRDLERLQKLLRGSVSIIALPSALILAAYILAPHLALSYSFGPGFEDAVLPLQVLSAGFMVWVLSGSNALTLTMTGYQRRLMLISIASIVLYVAITPVLALRWGAVGGALGISLLSALQNIIVTMEVKRYVGVWTFATLSPTLWRSFLRTLLRRSI